MNLLIGLVLALQIAAATYVAGSAGSACPTEASVIRTKPECEAALKALGIGYAAQWWTGTASNIPAGCSVRKPGGDNWPHFEQTAAGTGRGRGDLRPICRDGADYLGCYRDNGARDLPHYKGHSHDKNTCSKACVNNKYFGLQNYGSRNSECWCGNDNYGKHGKLADSECGPERRGRGWANAVYRRLTAASLVKGFKRQTVALLTTFELGFDVTPYGTVSGWNNILHLTASEQNIGNGGRIPGVWFHGGSTRMHVCIECDNIANMCQDTPQALAVGTKSRVVVSVGNGRFVVSVNGNEVASKTCNKPFVPANGAKGSFYTSDPWYPSAFADVERITYIDLATYVAGSAGSACPTDASVIRTKPECEAALKALGIGYAAQWWTGTASNIPAGCSVRKPGGDNWPHFEQTADGTGRGRGDLRPICRDAFTTSGLVASGTAIAGCDGRSDSTEAMLSKLKPAAENFADCDKDVQSIAKSLGKLKDTTNDVQEVSGDMEKSMNVMKNVIDRIVLLPPKGAGIADALGKVPKVGIYIKLGLKFAQKIVHTLEDLTNLFDKVSKKIDKGVGMGEKVFETTAKVTGPTSKFLTKSHEVLNAAHECAKSTGYHCGTAAAKMEEANGKAYPHAKDPLEDISTAGEVCHKVLNPMDAMLDYLAKLAAEMSKLLDPVRKILAEVRKFLDEIKRLIDEFFKALTESDEAMCALEILKPVTDVANLVTCPIAEISSAINFVIDNIVAMVETMLVELANSVITSAVDILVPDNFDLLVPNVQDLLPSDFWFAACTAASLASPEHAGTIQQLLALPLPYHVTGKDIEAQILKEALLTPPSRAVTYKSACVEAYKELTKTPEFKRCEQVYDKWTSVNYLMSLDKNDLLRVTGSGGDLSGIFGSITSGGNGYTYVGCFVDDWDRDMKAGPKAYGYDHAQCSQACHHYKFFALQDNGWCVCGDRFRTASQYAQRPDHECGSNLRGRGWRNAIFVVNNGGGGSSSGGITIGGLTIPNPLSGLGIGRRLERFSAKRDRAQGVHEHKELEMLAPTHPEEMIAE